MLQSASNLVNLAVDLTTIRLSKAEALKAIERAGFSTRELSSQTDDAALAWIDGEFGGSWSSEAFAGTTIVAYDSEQKHAGFVTYDPQGLRFRWLRGVAIEPSVGIFGPLGVAANYRAVQNDNEITLGQSLVALSLAGLRERGFTRALIPAIGDQRLIAYYERHANAHVVEEFERHVWFDRLIPTVVMASGNGSNFQAIIDFIERGELPLHISALICNKTDAYAIERARQANIPVHTLLWDRKNVTREAYDAALIHALEKEAPELTLLLGWMHVLPRSFVENFPNTVNIHPAFLPLDQSRDEVALPDGSVQPAFRGPRSAHDALQAGVPWIGATAHRLSLSADRGPILIRKPIHIDSLLDETEVMERLHPVEHEVVAAAIRRIVYES